MITTYLLIALIGRTHVPMGQYATVAQCDSAAQQISEQLTEEQLFSYDDDYRCVKITTTPQYVDGT